MQVEEKPDNVRVAAHVAVGIHHDQGTDSCDDQAIQYGESIQHHLQLDAQAGHPGQ